MLSCAQDFIASQFAVYHVWDDHDFSTNDADASAASRPAAMAVYRNLVPHYPLRGNDAPIFQAFTIGRVRVIITDTRSARDANGSMLGAEQLARRLCRRGLKITAKEIEAIFVQYKLTEKKSRGSAEAAR